MSRKDKCAFWIDSKNQKCKNNALTGKIFCNLHCSKYNRISEKPSECFCSDPFDEKTNPLIPCGHWVHLECIYKTGKKQCPICRADIILTLEQESKLVPIIPQSSDPFYNDASGNLFIQMENDIGSLFSQDIDNYFNEMRYSNIGMNRQFNPRTYTPWNPRNYPDTYVSNRYSINQPMNELNIRRQRAFSFPNTHEMYYNNSMPETFGRGTRFPFEFPINFNARGLPAMSNLYQVNDQSPPSFMRYTNYQTDINTRYDTNHTGSQPIQPLPNNTGIRIPRYESNYTGIPSNTGTQPIQPLPNNTGIRMSFGSSSTPSNNTNETIHRFIQMFENFLNNQ